MFVNSALIYHALLYTRERVGREASEELFVGTGVSSQDIKSRIEWLNYADLRRIVENFYFIFDREELYHAGKDFFNSFEDESQMKKHFPFLYILKKKALNQHMNENILRSSAEIASEINAAHNYKLVSFTPGRAVLTIRKNPRYDCEKIDFKLNDQDYINIICDFHKGWIESFFEFFKAKAVKVEERIHQRIGGEAKLRPHCLYHILWEVDHPESLDIGKDSQKQIDDLCNFFKIIIANDISKDFLETMYEYKGNVKQKDLAHKFNLSVESIKSRIKKIRKAFGTDTGEELKKLFNEKGYYEYIRLFLF